MQAYLRQQRRWLRVEKLPGYAPDLNPVEPLWGNLKGQELANRCADDLAEAGTAVRSGMARGRRLPELPFFFLKYSGLFFLPDFYFFIRDFLSLLRSLGAI